MNHESWNRLELRRRTILARRANTAHSAPLARAPLVGLRALTALSDTEARDLASVIAALCRIANGTYGVCTTCNRPVSATRLDAVPEADSCLVCLALARIVEPA